MSHYVDTVGLLWQCVEDRENSDAWSELLHRILPKLKHFIRGTLRQWTFDSCLADAASILGGNDLEDLTQTTILRLVENNCSLLRRFSGKIENDLFAYLAVISRSVVRDCYRRQHALKRASPRQCRFGKPHLVTPHPHGLSDPSSMEHRLLAREVTGLAERALDDANGSSERDRLIFRLHFFDGLSAAQICQCQEIGLTKAGVERILRLVTSRTRMLAQASLPEGAT